MTHFSKYFSEFHFTITKLLKQVKLWCVVKQSMKGVELQEIIHYSASRDVKEVTF